MQKPCNLFKICIAKALIFSLQLCPITGRTALMFVKFLAQPKDCPTDIVRLHTAQDNLWLTELFIIFAYVNKIVQWNTSPCEN